MSDTPPTHVDSAPKIRPRTMRMPDDQGPEADAPPAQSQVAEESKAVASAAPAGSFPMRMAPQDGSRIVVVSADGVRCTAVWRTSRKFNRKLMKWELNPHWANPLAAHAPVPFDPAGWVHDDWKAQS